MSKNNLTWPRSSTQLEGWRGGGGLGGGASPHSPAPSFVSEARRFWFHRWTSSGLCRSGEGNLLAPLREASNHRDLISLFTFFSPVFLNLDHQVLWKQIFITEQANILPHISISPCVNIAQTVREERRRRRRRNRLIYFLFPTVQERELYKIFI